MNGSNGNVIALLERIADGQDKLVQKLEEVDRNLRGEISMLRRETNARLDQTNARLDKTNARLDHMVTFMGKHHGDHERRLRVLERKVLKKSSG